MSINHDAHDHDADQATECVCGEVVRCPEAHVCKPIGWTQTIVITADLSKFLATLHHDHQEQP